MTTIATDGKCMVGDGLRDHLGSVTNRSAVKVRRLSDGSLVGTAGDVCFGAAVVEWLDKGCAEPEYKGDSGFTALILKPGGDLLIMGQDCRAAPIEPPFAIGSGMDFAIGAMRAGATPEQALAIACDCDPHTGGKITVLSLDQPARAQTKVANITLRQADAAVRKHLAKTANA